MWRNIVSYVVLTCSAIIISRGTTLKACRVGSTTVLIRRGSEIQDPSVSLSLIEAESCYVIFGTAVSRLSWAKQYLKKKEDEK